MFDYQAILKANPNGVLATQNGQGVGTRVFQYLFADANKVYFCTSNQKPVYDQLKANPNVSFCTYPANFSPVLSVNGKGFSWMIWRSKPAPSTRTPASRVFTTRLTILSSRSFTLMLRRLRRSASPKARKATRFNAKAAALPGQNGQGISAY